MGQLHRQRHEQRLGGDPVTVGRGALPPPAGSAADVLGEDRDLPRPLRRRRDQRHHVHGQLGREVRAGDLSDPRRGLLPVDLLGMEALGRHRYRAPERAQLVRHDQRQRHHPGVVELRDAARHDHALHDPLALRDHLSERATVRSALHGGHRPAPQRHELHAGRVRLRRVLVLGLVARWPLHDPRQQHRPLGERLAHGDVRVVGVGLHDHLRDEPLELRRGAVPGRRLHRGPDPGRGRRVVRDRARPLLSLGLPLVVDLGEHALGLGLDARRSPARGRSPRRTMCSPS